MANCITDCRSAVGITVGLIDGLIAIARVLAQSDLTPDEVQEALADLRADEDVARLLGPNVLAQGRGAGCRRSVPLERDVRWIG